MPLSQPQKLLGISHCSLAGAELQAVAVPSASTQSAHQHWELHSEGASRCLPFAPAIRAPAAPCRALRTESHLNKLRRHNKSKGNEGLRRGAGDSLRCNYSDKPLAVTGQRVPHAASADVPELAQLHSRAGSIVPSLCLAQHQLHPGRRCWALAAPGPQPQAAVCAGHTLAAQRCCWRCPRSRWQRLVQRGAAGEVRKALPTPCPCPGPANQPELQLSGASSRQDLQPVPRCLKALAHGCDSRKSFV